MADEDAKDEQAAHVAEQEAQVQAAQPHTTAPADVADDADDAADEAAKAKGVPPAVWLIWNKDQDRRYNHIPTQGSGANGELTPDEVQAYFRTRALYDEATKRDPDGKREPVYIRVRKAELRPNQPYVGDVKEGGGHAES